MKRAWLTLPAIAAAAVAAGGCDDNAVSPGTDPATATFRVVIENVSADLDFPASGTFAVPVGGSGPAPIGPGEAYEFEVGARPGARLSFATMFVHSNDLFYAPAEAGIALFDGSDQPISGDVTDQIMLWDAGTELNEEPGVGAFQAPRQPAPDTGAADTDQTVRPVSDAYTYPAVADVIGVTISPLSGHLFRVRIENRSTVGTIMTSTAQDLAAPLAPGVWVVHGASAPLFTSGVPADATGLEALAEDGSPGALGSSLAERSGIATPLAPGVFAVHGSGTPIFTEEDADRGEGLEGLAEDGAAAPLAAHLATDPIVSASGVFDTPDGAAGAGPAFPGDSYSFEFDATEGDYLSFATMFVQSNDLFLGPADGGLALFTGGTPVTGDVTAAILLWDAGTEEDEWPGVGPNQAPRQAGANTGAADSDNRVRRAGGRFPLPAADAVVRVTISTI